MRSAELPAAALLRFATRPAPAVDRDVIATYIGGAFIETFQSLRNTSRRAWVCLCC